MDLMLGKKPLPPQEVTNYSQSLQVPTQMPLTYTQPLPPFAPLHNQMPFPGLNPLPIVSGPSVPPWQVRKEYRLLYPWQDFIEMVAFLEQTFCFTIP